MVRVHLITLAINRDNMIIIRIRIVITGPLQTQAIIRAVVDLEEGFLMGLEYLNLINNTLKIIIKGNYRLKIFTIY